MVTRWNNVKGTCAVEVDRVHGGWSDVDDDSPIDPAVCAILDKHIDASLDWAEIVIGFCSAGEDDPGQCSGLPERCYPPEHWEERTLGYVEVVDHWQEEKKKVVRLSDEEAQVVFDVYQDEVDEAEVDWSQLEDWRV